MFSVILYIKHHKKHSCLCDFLVIKNNEIFKTRSISVEKIFFKWQRKFKKKKHCFVKKNLERLIEGNN